MTITEIEKLAGISSTISLGVGLERPLQGLLQNINKPSLTDTYEELGLPTEVPPVRTFDTLVKCSKNIPEIAGHLNRAKVFQFMHKGGNNANAPQLIKDAWSQEQVDNFHLPFPCIAVEDDVSCAVLHETDAAGTFGYIICIDFATSYGEKVLSVIRGVVTFEFPEKFIEDIFVSIIVYSQKVTCFKHNHQYVTDYTVPEVEQTMSSGLVSQHLSKAMGCIMLLNLPNKFILENAPVRSVRLMDRGKKKKKKNRILTSAERPVYVLLSPKEIREKTGMISTGGKVKAHERRRHIRTFRSDRFIKAQGKSIVIPATWVGESEKIVGNRRYKVLLDV